MALKLKGTKKKASVGKTTGNPKNKGGVGKVNYPRGK